MNAIALVALIAVSLAACSPPPQPPPPPAPTSDEVTAAKAWVKDAMNKHAVVSLNCERGQALVNVEFWQLEADKRATAETLIVACGLHPASATLSIHDAASAQALAIWRTGGLRSPE